MPSFVEIKIATKAYNRELRRNRKLLFISMLGGVCARCGQMPHHAAMEFHHLKDKKFTISQILLKDIEKIEKELQNCVLLCSNCHQILHYEERETDHKKLLDALK